MKIGNEKRMGGVLLAILLLGFSALPASAMAGQAEADGQKQTGKSTTGEYIVKLRDGARAKTSIHAAVSRDVSFLQEDKQYLLVKPSAHVREQVLETLAADPAVEYIEPNIRMYKTAAVTEPFYDEQWGLEAIDAPLAWEEADGSEQVVVAVIDTGVDYTHPDLADRVDTANDYDYVNRDSDAMDDDYEGHGTHVAGIIAAKVNRQGIAGVAGRADVKILPLKVLDERGQGYMYDTAMAIMDAADLGADVINLSLGGRRDEIGKGHPRLLQEAVDYAIAKGAVVVSAAGNNAADVNRYVPASLPGVIAVSAVDQERKLASFSNKGSSIRLAAPGVKILSTVPDGKYAYMTGTSMAAPFVSGTAALLLAVEPDLSVKEVTDRLLITATDLGKKGRDESYGYGLVNAYQALAYEPPPQKPSRLSANVSRLSLRPQGTAALTVTATYADKSKQDVTDDVSWESGNEEIATVERGVVTAHGFGRTNITASYAGKKLTIPVNIAVTRLEPSEKRLTMKPDGEVLLTIRATYADQTTEQVPAADIAWTSRNEEVATVQEGVVTARKIGSTTIRAAYGGKTVNIPVSVKLTKLVAEPGHVQMKPNETVPVTLYAYYGDEREEVTADAEWKTSNSRVAVAEDGEIVFKGFGKATITASYRGKTVRISVDTSLRKLQAAETSHEMKAGETYLPVITATYRDGSAAEVQEEVEQWISSNEKVAVVDEQGAITAMKAGISVITARYGGKQVRMTLRVQE